MSQPPSVTTASRGDWQNGLCNGIWGGDLRTFVRIDEVSYIPTPS